jgi:hypothetical protein
MVQELEPEIFLFYNVQPGKKKKTNTGIEGAFILKFSAKTKIQKLEVS